MKNSRKQFETMPCIVAMPRMARPLVCIALAAFVACEDPTNPTHEHQWGDWSVITAATCSVKGGRTRTCALDATHIDKEEIAIDPDAHNYQLSPLATSPTCTADGNGDQVCSYNAAHIISGVIPALGHDYQNWARTTAPTCTTAGVETGTCTHDATHKETRAIAIDPDAHDYQLSSETAPTCTTDGNGVQICSYNVAHIINGVISKLGHNYQNYTETTAPTCTTAGVETGICTHDQTHKDTRAITALGHDWDYDNITNETTPPTCETKGSGTVSCKRENCEETNSGTDNIPALGHDYQNYTQTTAPTCTTAGVETGTCTHDATHTETKAIAINLTAHAWGDWIETNPPTLTADAIETRKCSHNTEHKETQEGTLALNKSIEGITTYLATASEPVDLPVNISLGTMTEAESGWQKLLAVIATSNKKVNLDLSNSTITGTAFNPYTSTPIGGEEKIISLVLPETAENIPSGGGSIYDATFVNFTALIEVSGAGLNNIGWSAFASCSKLEIVDFPMVTYIAGNAFRDCFALKTANFPKATRIGSIAFGDCHALETLYVPSVTNIEQWAFDNSYVVITSTAALTITMGNTAPILGNNIFYGISIAKDVIVKVPKDATGYDTSWQNSFKGNNENINLTVEYLP